MRIFFASTSYPASNDDWQGLFIARMLEGLANNNDLVIDAWCLPAPLPAGVASALLDDDADWFMSLAGQGGIAHLLRTHPVLGLVRAVQLMRRIRRACLVSAPDLAHINWLQNTLPLPNDRQPLLVTVLGTDMQLLKLPGMRTMLRRVFRHRPVAICPNADWMLPELTTAFGDIATISFVPFGIDPRWYAIKRRFEGNAVPKWLCVSRLTRNKIGTLFDWAAPMFSDGRAELHLFGPMQEQLELPPWVNWHGPASPEALRDTWFPQAHGLITLSQHAEGRPQVMLEALASGLPIIASRLPAHDDLLAGGEGGVLVDSPDAVRAALDALADPAANRALGLRGRARMQREIGTWDDCAGRYVALYRQLQGQARR